MTAKFAGEAAAWAKRLVDAGDHELGPAHPMQRRVGEDRVELALEGKRMAVHFLHLEALGGSGCEQLLAQIGAKHVGAALGDLFSQHAVAAAKVEDALAFPRRQQIERRTGKLGRNGPCGRSLPPTSAAPASAVSFARRSFRRPRLPRFVVARDRLPSVWIEDAAGRPIGFRRTREVGLIGLLPGLSLVGFVGWRHVNRVMQPAVPFRRHQRGFGLGAVDHPAPLPVLGLVVDVAEAVLAHAGAVAPGEEAGADGVAGPPGEKLGQEFHAG